MIQFNMSIIELSENYTSLCLIGISLDLLWWYVYIVTAELLFYWENFKKLTAKKGLGRALSF